MHSRAQAFTASTIALSILAIATIIGGCMQAVPTVTGSTPTQHAERVSANPAVIQVKFNRSMMRKTVEQSFSISPDSGTPTFVWAADDHVLSVAFTKPFAERKVYTARLDTAAESRGGFRLTKPYLLKFATGSITSEAQTSRLKAEIKCPNETTKQSPDA